MKTWLPEIRVGKFLLREVQDSDFLDYYEIGSDSETVRHLNWGPFLRPQDSMWIIQEVFNRRPQSGIPKGYAIIYQSKMIGMIDYHTYYPASNSAEIGYILHRAFWGKGIMKKCLKAVTQIGFEHLELSKLIVGHTIENEASKHVILACGYKYEYQKMVNMKDNQVLANYYSMYRYEYLGGM